MKNEKPLIEIRTGSKSDIPKIKKAYEFLESVGIPYSPRVLSAHRTPHIMTEAARKLSDNGFYVSIAAAGGSAHLPGMTASKTLLPVVGLPVKTSSLEGKDSLYSIIQMPDGIPVGSVGVGQSESAAILAAQIAYNNNPEIRNKIRSYRGIGGKVSEVDNVPFVGIIKPSDINLNQDKYENMVFLMTAFGIKTKEYELSTVDSEGMIKTSRELENKGAKAVIALGALDDEESTNYFPRNVAEQTDLPTIGLPIAEGYAGSNDFIEGDIFNSLLGLTDIEEETKGCPVAGIGINKYSNAALYASQIVGLTVPKIQEKIKDYRESLAEDVKENDDLVQSEGIEAFV